MTRAPFIVATVLGLPIFIAVAVFGPAAFDLVFRRRPPERFLIPAGYSGWVRVDFRQKDAPPLPMEDARPSTPFARFFVGTENQYRHEVDPAGKEPACER